MRFCEYEAICEQKFSTIRNKKFTTCIAYANSRLQLSDKRTGLSLLKEPAHIEPDGLNKLVGTMTYGVVRMMIKHRYYGVVLSTPLAWHKMKSVINQRTSRY